MGPIACELYGREKRKSNMIEGPTLAQGTTDHEPGMLDNKFAFPGHCAVFVGVPWFNKDCMCESGRVCLLIGYKGCSKKVPVIPKLKLS